MFLTLGPKGSQSCSYRASRTSWTSSGAEKIFLVSEPFGCSYMVQSGLAHRSGFGYAFLRSSPRLRLETCYSGYANIYQWQNC